MQGVSVVHYTYITSFGDFTIGSDTTAGGEAIVMLKSGSAAGAIPGSEKKPTALTDRAAEQLAEYFARERRVFDLPLRPRGTAFERTVWDALMDIPYGETRSYKQIAEAVGNPLAYRAVGMANNKNPIWIIIPCHRVLGSDGGMVGYRGGLAMKERLLRMEGNTGRQ